jgi:hypothetical protein
VRSELFLGIVFLCVFALLSFAPSAMARPQRQSQLPPPPRGDITAPASDEDEARARIASDMAKRAAKERAAAIKSDTDRLLRLSVELKQSVDKSGENVLSLDVIKKAEEIEKLAHSVKEKMKGPN